MKGTVFLFLGFLKKEDNLMKENFETFCWEKMILSTEFLVEKYAYAIKSKFCTFRQNFSENNFALFALTLNISGIFFQQRTFV